MDDLGNHWGTILALEPDGFARRYIKSNETFGDLQHSAFSNAISSTFNDEWHLWKIANCGSDAQAFALLESTKGSLDACMIACGSYVAGTRGGLQNWSTSHYDVHIGCAIPTNPEMVQTDYTKSHTVGLPYHLPGPHLTMAQLEAYEERCLLELHVRCLIAKVNNRPYRTILMELILAGCGATLSDRALVRLAELARHHNFSITLDEIMTGGRCGTMLLVLQKPSVFQAVVRFVTMGKWMKGGLVLISDCELRRRRAEEPDHTSYRGASVKIDCSSYLLWWRDISEKAHKAPERRAEVLRKFNFQEEETWGLNGMIFIPAARKDSGKGLKCRMLPLLDSVQIDTIPLVNKRTEWNKANLNRRIMRAVHDWVQHRPSHRGEELRQEAIRYFIQFMSHHTAGDTIVKKDAWKVFSSATTTKHMAKHVIDLCMLHRLVKNVRKGPRRVETYVLQDIACFPFHIHVPIVN